jgi:hypothetical protein
MQLLKSRIMRWVGHVAYNGGRGEGFGGETRGTDGKVMLNAFSRNGIWGTCARLISLRIKKSSRLFLMW